MQKFRGFECPESGAPCIDDRCTLTICCEREKLRVAEKAAAVDREKRTYYQKMWEIIGPVLNKGRNSN